MESQLRQACAARSYTMLGLAMKAKRRRIYCMRFECIECALATGNEGIAVNQRSMDNL